MMWKFVAEQFLLSGDCMIGAKKLRENKFDSEYILLRNLVEQKLLENHDEYHIEIVELVGYHITIIKLVRELMAKGYDVEYHYKDSVLKLVVEW